MMPLKNNVSDEEVILQTLDYLVLGIVLSIKEKQRSVHGHNKDVNLTDLSGIVKVRI